MSKFKVGDRVRIVKLWGDEDDEDYHDWLGKEAIVENYNAGFSFPYQLEGWEFGATEDMLELVEAATTNVVPQPATEDTGSAVTSKHYNAQPIQPIEMMQALMTPEEFVGFCKGNFIKYSMRAGSKQGESSEKDTNKAKQYHMWWQLAQDGVVIDPRKHFI